MKLPLSFFRVVKSTSNLEEKSTGYLARPPRKFQGGELLRSTCKYIPLSTRLHRLLYRSATSKYTTQLLDLKQQFLHRRYNSNCSVWSHIYLYPITMALTIILATTYASKRLLYGAGIAPIMSTCLTQQAQICCMELTFLIFNLTQFPFSSPDSNSLEPVANEKHSTIPSGQAIRHSVGQYPQSRIRYSYKYAPRRGRRDG